MNEAGSDVFGWRLNQLIDLAPHDLAGTHVDIDQVLILEEADHVRLVRWMSYWQLTQDDDKNLQTAKARMLEKEPNRATIE